MAQPPAASAHRWRFFRIGGFDQVAIDTADDLRHLDELDPKLWTALGCPTTGLEFDARTLALLDTDGDGQIRVPEVLAAVRWACSMLKDPQVLFGPEGLALAAIDDGQPDGATLRATAAKVLGLVGKSDADALVVADFADTARLFASGHFNGDGIVTAALIDDETLRRVIGEIVETQGAVTDRSGEPGITADTLAAFFEQAAALNAWRAQRDAAADTVLPLGADTPAAAEALAAVQGKIDDYFARCQLAAFDPRAGAALNPPETAYGALATRAIATVDTEVEALPLAAIAAGRPLPLASGLNPSWAARMAAFQRLVVEPLLGERETLSGDDWAALTTRFAAWREWQGGKPESKLHDLDAEHLARIAGDDTRARLAALIEQDLAADTSVAKVDAVERLVRYQRDLVTLLRNFVTLSDFYNRQRKAIFQAGTLYLDQRSCELALRVADMDAHAAMAPFSGCYLVYCNCARAGSAPMTIVAALTGGSVDELMVPGRHGVFFDRDGNDWMATVVKVVEQPVSIRQAFWSPYRRLGAFIEAQIRKFAESRDKDVEAKAQAGVTDAAAKAGTPAAAAPAPAFDIAKFAGIFAAIGLAVGAIGTALTAALTGLFALAWWQAPIVIAAVLLAISAPSMLLAFLTLRRRNLGPLLDANGWAVNARARINIPFGGALTGVAELPEGSTRSLSDPSEEKKSPWKTWLVLVVLAIVAIAAWRQGMLDRLLGG